MDRRTTPFSGRIAHVSLKGRIDAPLTTGEAASVAPALADLLARAGGPRDRQLIHGEALTVIDRQDGHAHVMAATHLYQGPKAQSPMILPLYLGAQVAVTGVEGKWAATPQGYVPAMHLAPIGQRAPDPVAVAEMFLHTPYYWGGNSAAGIDCSGLAQAALLAAGIPCPGDSDLQQAVGLGIPDGAPLQRGDLIFWKGHVALMVSADRIIHANGGTMSVAYEGLQDALTRIEAQGEGGLVARRRP